MNTPVVTPAEAQRPAPTPTKPAKPLPSVRALLIRLIFVCLLPPAIGAGIWLFNHSQAQRAGLEKDAIEAARAKVQTVDAELAKAEFFAQTLATSPLIPKRDFAGFQARALQLMQDGNIEFSVNLYDATGQQRVNINMPFGQPLNKSADLRQTQEVFATRQPSKQQLIFRKLDGRSEVATMVPVFVDKEVLYTLAVGFTTDRLNTILSQLDLDTGLVASIIDDNGTVVARSLDADKLIGQKSHPEILKSKVLENKLEGIVKAHSQDGVPLFVAYSSSPSSGWGVVIGNPRQTLESPLRHTFMVFGLSVALVLLLSLTLAWLVGERIARSVRSLQAAALAFGNGQAPDLPAASLAETEELRQTLQMSASRLKRRTQQLEVANANLLERSTELSEAQHIAHIGNWKWDAGTGVFFVSDELQRLYGRKVLLPFAELEDKVFADAAWQELRSAAKVTLQTKAGFSLLLLTLLEDDSQIWTRVNGEAVCNAAGEVIGLRGTLQNVDAYVKGEMALLENAKRYRTLFDESPEAIVVHLNGIIAFANASAVSLFEAATEAGLAGLCLTKFVHLDFQQAVAARLVFIAQAGKPLPPLELKFITLQGRTFSALSRSTQLLFEGQRYIQTHIHDLTASKRHDADMARLHTEMRDMLVWQVAQHTVAALAHEVNQPLASVSILCEVASRMLQTEGMSEEAAAQQALKFQKMLENIAAETMRAGVVLRNLVHSVSQPNITRAPAQADELVTESVRIAIEEGVFDYPILIDCAADLPAVQVNHLQVVKVLLNLLHNGAQAMHAAHITNGGLHVSTALSADGSEVRVSVRDQGPGISADLQAEVFQPFITTKLHGLGMGLTISRALIEANGGKLWHTPNDGPGATFHFTLPVLG